MFDDSPEAPNEVFGLPRDWRPRPAADTAPEWAAPGVPRATVDRAAERVVSEPVAALVQAAAVVAGQVPADLPGPVALADTAALLGVVEQLRGTLLTRVADVDSRALHTLDDAPSTSSWIHSRATSIGRREVALAKRMSTFPTLDTAVRDGALPVLAAERISKALARLRRHVDRPDGLIDGQDGELAVTAVVLDGVRLQVSQARTGLTDDDPRLAEVTAQLSEISCWPVSQLARLEAAFVLLAQHLEPGQLHGALAELVDALLPNELEKRSADAHANRGFGITRTSDGSGWHVTDGDLDLELGELLHAVLTAQLATDPDNPADTEGFEALRASGWQPGDPIPADHGLPTGPRSLRQRQHDALKTALRRLLDSGALGARDKTAPHIAVTVGLEQLNAAPGALPATGSSGASLPLSLIKTWWCDAFVTRYVLSLGRKVLETSHTARTLKASERRAKHLETGGHCQGAGCTRGPGHQLIPHHITPWATCRTTSRDDTALLCEQHHHQLHTGRTLTLKNGVRINQHGRIEQ